MPITTLALLPRALPTHPSPGLASVYGCLSISLRDEREREFRRVYKLLPTAGLFHPLKRQLALLRPLHQIRGTLSCQVSQGAGPRSQIVNELLVEARQPQEPPHLFSGQDVMMTCNCCCLVSLWMHLPTAKGVPQILLYLPPSNRRLLPHMLSTAVTVEGNVIKVGSSICSIVSLTD